MSIFPQFLDPPNLWIRSRSNIFGSIVGDRQRLNNHPRRRDVHHSSREVLVALDITGSGHTRRLIDEEPWKGAYVVFKAGADPHFVPDRA